MFCCDIMENVLQFQGILERFWWMSGRAEAGSATHLSRPSRFLKIYIFREGGRVATV